MKTISTILSQIGISNHDDNFYLFQDNLWQNIIPIRLHKGLREISPHSFLVNENKIIALFFNFTPNDNIDLSPLFKKIWNLGGSSIIFIITADTVNIYNGFSFDTKTALFDKLKIANKPVTADNINANLSIWDMLTGKTFANMNKPKALVDEKLLENLEKTKNILAEAGLKDTFAQNIIGRLLFSRYLLDRGVKIESRYFTNRASFLQLIENKELLYEYFDYLKETFNGDLFPVVKEEISQVTNKHLNYLYQLFSGSDIGDGMYQPSLFELYDFNIIPIELISEVYERFIGKHKQQKNAAYYTPSFLVDYILEKSIKPHLNKASSCKVFDPSCGSGIFLVESLRTIIEKNLDNNGQISKINLKQLLTNNIFGVDIDSTAINLTVFSLCLTLLDYVDPKDITKFKFPNLLGYNLFNADFFDTNHPFNHKIKNIDFILGNPPWGSDKAKNSLHIQYFTDKAIPISDKQIAQTFVARTADFSTKQTKCVMVLPSKPILYNHNANEFRHYFLEQFKLKELLELSPVRNQIFSGAIAPTTIIFFNYAHGNPTANNIILHTAIKPNIFLKYLKLIVIEKSDIKQIKQNYFMKYDYLWKIMLYGNVLDFHLIKRLKENYDSLNQVIEKNKLSYGQGFIVGGKQVKKHNALFLAGKKYLDTKKKILSKFFVNDVACENWTIDKVHRPRTAEVFQPPYVLLKRAFVKEDFSFIATYTENEYIFSNLVTAIRGKNRSILKMLSGIINSKVYSYFLLQQGTSAGIEREESLNKEKLQFPFVLSNKIVPKVDAIQLLYKSMNSTILQKSELESQIKAEENQLNEIILDAFELSDTEKSLIDYATQITIPQINNGKEPIATVTENQLKIYSQIFMDHFSQRWSGNPNYFAIDIYYDNHLIGINFKIVDAKPKQLIQLFPIEQTAELFQLIKIGEEKITDTFYKQRDVRGFNESSFYVIKPNQYKNWHPAVAYGDLAEFIEAMLKAEKDNA